MTSVSKSESFLMTIASSASLRNGLDERLLEAINSKTTEKRTRREKTDNWDQVTLKDEMNGSAANVRYW